MVGLSNRELPHCLHGVRFLKNDSSLIFHVSKLHLRFSSRDLGGLLPPVQEVLKDARPCKLKIFSDLLQFSSKDFSRDAGFSGSRIILGCSKQF